MDENSPKPSAAPETFSDDIDSCCSTPFVSAPSSPGRDIIPPPLSGFYFSAPSSPMHFVLSASSSHKSYGSSSSAASGGAFDSSFEFDLPSSGAATADELFFNGQIRPMKLSTHLEHPQLLDPLIESEENENEPHRGRELKLRAGSLRRRTRSMSPMRNSSFEWDENAIEDLGQNQNQNQNAAGEDEKELELEEENNKGSEETTPCASRSSSAGRNSSSRRWVFLKELLYRSKSEGRNHEGHKFWGSISLKEKDKKLPIQPLGSSSTTSTSSNGGKGKAKKNVAGKRTSPSPHEVHYTAKRAQAEEMRKRTFLPYRQGLLGCLGFSSKGYGAMNGFARALNPTVSSS